MQKKSYLFSICGLKIAQIKIAHRIEDVKKLLQLKRMISWVRSNTFLSFDKLFTHSKEQELGSKKNGFLC